MLCYVCVCLCSALIRLVYIKAARGRQLVTLRLYNLTLSCHFSCISPHTAAPNEPTEITKTEKEKPCTMRERERESLRRSQCKLNSIFPFVLSARYVWTFFYGALCVCVLWVCTFQQCCLFFCLFACLLLFLSYLFSFFS